MKIGVLTLVPKNNYGGILQATALCGYLESQGHDVVLINKKRFEKPLLAKAVIGVLERLPFQNIKNKRQDYLKTKQLKPFLKKYLPRVSREIVSAKELEKLVEDEKFDAVIVGSDQVWRYPYIGDGHHNVFFLDFDTTRPIKKIAYAASFGKDVWEAPEYVDEISYLLSQFDAISTREKSGITLCQNTFSVSDVKNVLDPTMLVGAEFYNRFFDNVEKDSQSQSLVTYILDKSQEKQNIIDSVKRRLETDTAMPLKQINLAEENYGIFYGVEEWLWQIKNAKFVVTDSFHGMIFSILFEKQFIVIGNEKRGLSRFTDFLDEVGLSNRLVLNRKDAAYLLEERVEYLAVEEEISKLREKSVFFLKNN